MTDDITQPEAVRLVLTMQQIKELAEFTGMVVDSTGFDEDYMQGMYVIADCPAGGVLNDGEPGDPDTRSHYEFIVYCDDCPEEGCVGLGPEIAAAEQHPRQAEAVARPQHGDDAEDGLRYVLCQVGFGEHYKNWLLIPHVDGQYVTAAKLVPFSMSILHHQLAKVDREREQANG